MKDFPVMSVSGVAISAVAGWFAPKPVSWLFLATGLFFAWVAVDYMRPQQTIEQPQDADPIEMHEIKYVPATVRATAAKQVVWGCASAVGLWMVAPATVALAGGGVMLVGAASLMVWAGDA